MTMKRERMRMTSPRSHGRTMGMKGAMRWGGAIALLMTAFLAAGAGAAELVREPFETVPPPAAAGSVPGSAGLGWTQAEAAFVMSPPVFVDIPVTAGSAVSEGTISFDLQRKPGDVKMRRTVFALMGDSGTKNLFRLMIEWSSDHDPSRPMIYIGDRLFIEQGILLWSREILLDRAVRPGQWVHIDLVWDDLAGRYDLYLDGRPQETTPTIYYPEGESAPDTREELARHYDQSELPGEFRERPFGWFLQQAKNVRVGANYWKPGGEASSPMSNAAIDNFVVTVDEPFVYGVTGYTSPDGGVAGSIASLGHDAARAAGFSGRLVAGDSVTVTMEGTPGVPASFDVARVADAAGEVAVRWAGFGVYLEEKTFFDEGEVDLRDVDEYRVYAATGPISTVTQETDAAEVLEVDEQSVVLEGLEPDTPYYIAVMALMEDGTFLPVIEPDQGIAMTEVEDVPGTYEGTFTADYQDRYPEAVIVARLGSGEGEAVMVSDETFEIDGRLNIEVLPSPEELKADEKSTSEITVTVTDTNGDAVEGHEVRFLLATTSRYTGVVGGGAFTDEVGGTLDRDFRGETNMSGRVTATYTAGFAAKTAIIVARDMVSNDTGAGFIKTYINAAAQLELEAPTVSAGKALGYTIAVTSSDEWLTADGESDARITAFVALDGIPVEGHRVGFTIASGSGKIRTVRGETGSDGRARAVYTAGTKIGLILIRATDHTAQISGTVQIELRSDAPAKISLALSEEVLPADGHSTAEVAVVVTDINDNPNEGIEVEYSVRIGSGRIRDVEPVTDRRGESTAEYVAGTIPGQVSIEVTVRSAVPTEEEMLAAREMALAVMDHEFF
jgi:hypothetical protein